VWSQIFGSASPIAPFYRFTIDITFTRSYTKKKLWWGGGMVPPGLAGGGGGGVESAFLGF